MLKVYKDTNFSRLCACQSQFCCVCSTAARQSSRQVYVNMWALDAEHFLNTASKAAKHTNNFQDGNIHLQHFLLPWSKLPQPCKHVDSIISSELLPAARIHFLYRTHLRHQQFPSITLIINQLEWVKRCLLFFLCLYNLLMIIIVLQHLLTSAQCVSGKPSLMVFLWAYRANLFFSHESHMFRHQSACSQGEIPHCLHLEEPVPSLV